MAAMAAPLGLAILEKLGKNNLQLWKLEVLPAIRGAQLEGHLDSKIPMPAKEVTAKDGEGKEIKIPNPEYATWVAQDQQVLSYLPTTMTRDVMTQVAMAKNSAELWAMVEAIFSSQSHMRSVNTQLHDVFFISQVLTRVEMAYARLTLHTLDFSSCPALEDLKISLC
ncbi:unnamed protein product [Urochloa humidicola]